MFESKARLDQEIKALLATIRDLAGARYACLLEPARIVFESPEPEDADTWALRRLLEEKSRRLFSIPQALASGGDMEDLFDDWDRDEFFLAFINGRIALALACPEAEPLKALLRKPLQVLSDRLFRYNEAYRLDPQGRGLFFGRPRLDLIVVGRADPGA